MWRNHLAVCKMVGHVIQKGKGDWVMLCFEHDTIRRFKLHNLEQVPALDRTHMDDSVKPNWNSPTHSVHVFNAGGSTLEEYVEEGIKESTTSATSTSSSSTLSESSNSSSLNSLCSTSLYSWSSLIRRSVHFHTGRSLSSLERVYWEESDSEQSDSSNSTLSSVAEEEYGNSLRVLMDAFVNFLEQVQQVNRQAARDNIKCMAQQLTRIHDGQFLYAEQCEVLAQWWGHQVSDGTLWVLGVPIMMMLVTLV